MSSEGARSDAATSFGIALVALSSLAFEVALVRVLSVSLWYHFAFMVVSTAVLGFGISGMALGLWPGLQSERGRAAAALAYPFTLLGGFFAANALPFDPFDLGRDPAQLAIAAPFYAAIAAPFLGAGLVIGGVLASAHERAPRLYAFDLVGAGLGAMLVTFAFGVFGGTGTIVVIGAVACAGSALLSRAKARMALAALAAGLALAAPRAERVAPVRITDNKIAAEGVPMARVIADPKFNLHSTWNAESKIDVLKTPRGVFIAIDGGVALVRVPRAPRQGALEAPMDATTLGFAAIPGSTTLIIGSGAGHEVLGALAYGARRVVAVEVNGAITALLDGVLKPIVGRLFADPRVVAVTDEGRSFLERSTERFDLIVSAHTISNAATMSGALALSESYTLTIEAFGEYLDHLEDRGLLLITRPESQLPRLFVTARAALEARGVTELDRHLVAFRQPQREEESFTAAFLLSRQPIPEDTLARLIARADAVGLEARYVSTGTRAPELDAIVRAPELASFLAEDPRELSPATDDRPFFLQTLRWSTLDAETIARVFDVGERGRLALEDAPVGEVTVLVLLAQVALLAALFSIGPIVVARRRGAALPAWAFGYFCALGLGFVFVELGLVHRLSLFIGPPTATFAAVIGGLLVWSGIGSAIADRGTLEAHGPRVIGGVIGAVVLTSLLVTPITSALLGAPLAARIAAAIALIGPVGLALGMPFPLGLRALGAEAPRAVAIAWGINGFFSVLGSVTTVVLSMALGFRAVLVAGALAYVLALLCAVRAARLRG